MRTIPDQEAAIIRGGRGACLSRLSVRDSGGTWRDLSTIFGRDWLMDWTVDVDIDRQFATLAATVARDNGPRDSFSPLRTDVRSYALSSSPLIAAGAEVLLETMLVPGGGLEDTTGTDWTEAFRGHLDSVDFGANPMKLAARDLGGKLQDLWIRSDTAMASGSMESVIQRIVKLGHGADWTAATAVVAQSGTTPGTTVTPTTHNGYYYRCTTGGTTHATTQPTWPTTIGNTVSDGTAVWTCEGAVPTLWVKTSPSFTMNAYLQQPMSVMEAINRIAAVIGYDVRYLWRESSSAWELALWAPDRSPSSEAFEFDADHYFKDPAFRIDRSTIRNHVTVTWSDPADLDNAGRPKRKTTTATDWASMLAYTHKMPAFCAIAEGSTSPIDSSGEASTLAGRVLSDLKDPKTEAQYVVQFFGAIEPGDYLLFNGDETVANDDLSLAVTGYSHNGMNNGAVRTTLRLRGVPASGVYKWLSIESGEVIPIRTEPPSAPSSVTLTASLDGFIVDFTAGDRTESVELHVSTSNGFTPSSSTLTQVSPTKPGTRGRFLATKLTAGNTYYVKLIARDRWNNPSAPSTQQSIAVAAASGLLSAPAVSGTPNSLSAGTVESQLAALLGFTNRVKAIISLNRNNTSSPTVANAVNATASENTGTGVVTVTFSSALATANYQAVCQTFSGTNGIAQTILSKSTTAFTYRSYDTASKATLSSASVNGIQESWIITEG